ncbi:hypothetical protein [Dyella jiangningensis]|uniref:hypothetical protein n=1 Tax=Dyella jiangningensis TaxID=1379159 RepID=UPI001559E8E6|nr:hypothetical protein [Dyella jiangningensis]
MAIHVADALQPSRASGRKAALTIIVVAVGLVLGAVLGVIGALYFGLIDFRC